MNAVTGLSIEFAKQVFNGCPDSDYVFDALLTDMPLIINDFSELHSSELTNDYGEYAINRTINGENRLFFIYFVKEGIGFWRIDSM